MTNPFTPTLEQELGNEIARVRKGQDITASDLANRLMPWLTAHGVEVWREGYRAGNLDGYFGTDDEYDKKFGEGAFSRD